MISFNEMIDLIAQSFFDGDMAMAGIVAYIIAILAVLGLTREPFYALIAGMAVTMFFTVTGTLSTELAVLLIVVSVLGLAYTSRSVWRS